MVSSLRAKRIRDTLIALAVTVICALVGFLLFDIYYDMNDDILIKDILAGTYTGVPDGHNIQMLFPIGALIAGLYRLFPAMGDVQVPWYGLFLCALHIACCFLVLRRTMSFTTRFWGRFVIAGAGLLMFLGLLLMPFVYIQYTVTSGVLSATGIFLFYTTDDELEAKAFFVKNIIPILLLTLSFYLRTEMMLLLCPMMLVAGVCKWFYGSSKASLNPFSRVSFTKYLSVPIILGILMGLGLLVNAIAYGGKGWDEFGSFFDARTEVYDFQNGAPRYTENEEFYDEIGLAQGEVTLFDNYNFALDTKIDSDAMDAISEYNRDSLGKTYFQLGFAQTLSEYIYRMFHKEDAPYNYMVWLLYVLIGAIGALRLDLTMVAKVGAMFVARSISWMYIIARGRTPDRITIPLYVCEILILIAMFLLSSKILLREYYEENEENYSYRKWFPVTAAILISVLLLIPGIKKTVSAIGEMQYRQDVNEEWDALKGYFAQNPGNYYVLDVYSTVKYSEKIFENVDNSYRNFEICGGWGAKSPIYADKLSKLGVSNIESDLINMKNVYFVIDTQRDIDWLVAYYKDKGQEVRLENKGILKINGNQRFAFYKVKRHV
ncbi:MAG: hypothetical protein KBS85_04575 [Lachnospiraceae bacterium]|nr:hypothetical protein [Candidatus Merdinaster equi]